MFEDFFNTVGVLLTIAFWIATIFTLVSGVILCIEKFTSRNGWEILHAVIAIIIGVFVFSKTYEWIESIPWALLFTGCALSLVLGDDSDERKKSSQSNGQTSLTDAMVDYYCDYSKTKAAVKDALRELDK